MEREVLSFIERRQLIKGPATVLVGVSGGPDSMALLHFLNQYKNLLNINLIALTVDHQLRGDVSRAEGNYVKDKCEHWSIPFIQKTIDVKSYMKKNKVSQQTASRELRYAVYENVLKKTEAHYLALGHHADDQVETMLMALTKVTRPEVLSGIPISRFFNGSEIIRPLLSVNKIAIETYCEKYRIHPRYDASNEDLDYERNYFREMIVPLLQERNPNLYKTAQIMSENLQSDHAYINKEAQILFDSLLKEQKEPHRFILKKKKFQKYAKSLQRRVYKLILDYLYKNKDIELSYEHEAIFMQLIDEETSNQVLDFPYGLKLEKSYEDIHFFFSTIEVENNDINEPLILNLNKTINLDLNKKLSSTLLREDTTDLKTSDSNIYYFEKESVELPLKVRKRKPGDRISWQGLNGSKKIKDILIDNKVPRTIRDKLFIVTDSKDEVLWVIGLVKGLPQNSNGTGPYIKLEYKEI